MSIEFMISTLIYGLRVLLRFMSRNHVCHMKKQYFNNLIKQHSRGNMRTLTTLTKPLRLLLPVYMEDIVMSCARSYWNG